MHPEVQAKRFLDQLYWSFKGWNQHTPAKLADELLGAIETGEWRKAQAIAPELHKHCTAFNNPNPEGQYFWTEWNTVKNWVENHPLNEQLNLFTEQPCIPTTDPENRTPQSQSSSRSLAGK